MRKFFQGVAIAAIFGTMFFGADFNKVEASGNLDANLNITAEDADSKSIRIIFGPPPRHRQPPPPPRHRVEPPRHRYDPPPRHYQPGPPPPHQPGPPHRPGPSPRR